MLGTLRNRLLASYVAILLILLLLIGFVLLVFLATRPLPTDDIVNDLTAALLDVRVFERSQVEVLLSGDGGFGDGQNASERPTIRVVTDHVIEFLDGEAEAHDLRAMLVTNSGIVLHDTAMTYAAGERVAETERTALVAANRRLVLQTTIYKGRFTDPNGDEWIYVAQSLRPLPQIDANTVMVLVAAPVPQQTLRQVFRVFGSTFLTPLAEAGLIGLIAAIGLSFLISRSVARPLQRISEAAQRIASGKYRQRVPVEGPKEVRSVAQSFNYMAGRVAATQQAQQDFLANVSHDLRTPLTSIQGFSQAIMEGVAADPDSAQHAAQIIYDEAGRLHRMVESLLDLARIESDRLNMRNHAIGLTDLLQGIEASLAFKAQEKGLTLHAEVPLDLPRIPGDGDRLAQVFTNLIDNAIKHTPSGGSVTLRATASDNGVAIAVQDTGVGIPAEDLPRIFERFYQVDKSRESNRRSGMGLGLAIAKEIIEAHGGSIQVASKVGRGTIFTVWLPFLAPDVTTVVYERS